ncbi:MAG: copper resistance protein CopC, partial [Dehalococcoidia bacterium]
MSLIRTLRWPAAVVVALAAAALATTVAQAHSGYDHSDPAAGAVVDSAPAEVNVWFTEAVSIADSSLTVTDAMGTRVDLDDSRVDTADTTHIAISLQADLPHGVYTVHWTVVSEDGHEESGEFEFGAGHGAHPAAPTGSVPTEGIDAEVEIASPAVGATITGSDLPLTVHLHNVTLIALGAHDHAVPAGTLGGHLHVSVDGTALGMVAQTEGLTIRNLGNGTHTITVSLATAEHQDYDPPVEQSVTVTVSGSTATGSPSLTTAGTAVPAAAATGMAGLAAPASASIALSLALVALTTGLVAAARRATA